uniref:Uncharacterized protein n=1 Tax=Physcomitrium patens TaxID=3218 RepID=A0A2K1KPK5_PHYPA|nr:hypothetical protein PHYPA_006609 [Physcomitrium patens]
MLSILVGGSDLVRRRVHEFALFHAIAQLRSRTDFMSGSFVHHISLSLSISLEICHSPLLAVCV